MISKTKATQTLTESIIESVGDLFIVLNAETNKTHVNARGGAPLVRKVMGSQIKDRRVYAQNPKAGLGSVINPMKRHE